jgi:CheY-like chemotaxis protein
MSLNDAMNWNFNILIVDDNSIDVKLASKIIEKVGYRTAIAPDGETALDLIKANVYDLILPDIFMPGIDGFEVYLRLQKNLERNKIPIIF